MAKRCLANWGRFRLVNHIKHDDRDYTGVVKENMQAATQRVKAKKGSWMKRLFG